MATALVTGGTAGIGNAFARELANRGYDLVLVARDTQRLSEVAAELHDRHGVEVETITADLSVREDMDLVAGRIEDPDRPIEMVINNAGFGIHGSLLDPDVEVHVKALDVMCLAVLILSGAAGRAMKARGHGSIINIASSAAIITTGNYSAVKAWALNYTEGLSVELAGTGVKVTAVMPGWVHTEFHQRAGIRAGNLPEWVWLSAEEVAKDALDDNEAGNVISIPAKRWTFAVNAARLIPRRAIRWFSGKLSASRRKKH
ncbi:MAG TPA: SDR family oxidoreductase [Propionibacteriaceae bacterium]|nr:SDR family oxidoreductase [Propionibacteriaceae bacterium]HPZ49069.1 SDR family oxidoreductase [Propionibacteriaceae bacterium]HQE31865.1 SDR family oxidoreductase [Propionibacteriaceae bacterium]